MKRNPSLLLILVGLLAAMSAVSAQTAAERLEQQQRQTAPRSATEKSQENAVPALYEGEMEDLGPQFLLLAKPKPKLFEYAFDFQTYRTSNATLANIHTSNADVTVLSHQFSYLMQERAWYDWKVKPRLGVRYQLFRYGVLRRDDKRLGATPGTVADTLDFDSRVLFGDLTFEKGPWVATFGLTYTSIIQGHGRHDNLYYEWVPAWSVGRSYQVTDRSSFFLMYDGNYRFTETITNRALGVQPDSWADRTDHAFNVIFSTTLADQWLLQPSYRIQRSYYLAKNNGARRDRNDLIQTVNLTATYFWNKYLTVRLFTSYEDRTADEGNLKLDYANWNAGLGGSFNIKF